MAADEQPELGNDRPSTSITGTVLAAAAAADTLVRMIPDALRPTAVAAIGDLMRHVRDLTREYQVAELSDHLARWLPGEGRVTVDDSDVPY